MGRSSCSELALTHHTLCRLGERHRLEGKHLGQWVEHHLFLQSFALAFELARRIAKSRLDAISGSIGHHHRIFENRANEIRNRNPQILRIV